MGINMRKSSILKAPCQYFSFLRDLVVYVCMATENAKMTNLIANYLINKRFTGEDPRARALCKHIRISASEDQFKPISKQIGSVLFAQFENNKVF